MTGVMTPATLVLAVVLSQEAPVEPSAAEPAPAAAPSAEVAMPAAPAAPAKPKGVDEVAKLMKKLPELSPEERLKSIAQIQKLYGATDSNPILPPSDIDFSRYADLPPVEQAKVTARHFFTDLINGDPSGMLAHCGFPFMLEDRRVEKPDDLRADWVKSLHSKRTDLLRLYDLEILSGAEMEKKYGPAPKRLSSWNVRAANSLLAVANVSGHATVLLLKQVGIAWQVVAYHD